MNTINRFTDNSIPYIDRILDLPALVEKKSYFLFGPRQTGKTFLIRHTLKGVRVYDLLDTSIYLALSQNPGRIAQELNPQDRIVVIDEIQRLPELLNEVHRLIEERGVCFLLTGSTVRVSSVAAALTYWEDAREQNIYTLSRIANWAIVSTCSAR